ncbi:TPA: hypothetical protein NKZ51_004730 [Vibrio parahaemolyticus]|nr:hypothetical protein [Vibrio parahaemolyticus]
MKLTDEFVKSIFDNIRNFSLSALVIAVSIIVLRDNHVGCQDWYFYFIGGVIFILGIVLFSINATHAWKKFQESIPNKCVLVGLAILYILIAIECVRVIFTLKVGL